MAPWPGPGNELKAPDKEDKPDSEDTTNIELDNPSENTLSAKSDQKQSEEKEVLTLDEGQLKALLDEAITYKNPKDRFGKSELFKELLQEAEADESDRSHKESGSSSSGKLPKIHGKEASRKKQSRHGQSRECGVGVSNTRGGSLQNLHSAAMEGGGRRSRRRDTLVSARQREGGSLPTNVNIDNDPDLDMICPNYTSRATLQVSGPSNEDTASIEETNAPSFSKVQGHNSLPNGTEPQHTKEDDSRANELVSASSISVGPVESGAMLYPTTPVQHVSVLSIPPSQIHASSDDHSSEPQKLNVSRSRPHRKTHSEEADNASEGLLGLPLTAYWNRYSSFTLLDFQDANTRMAFGNSTEAKTKPLDENGNALACVRVDSNCLDRKKQRRVKAKNDRNTILSDEIEGFRGGADIDTLMEYIESPSLETNKNNKARSNQANGTRSSVKVRAKEEEPRSLKRRKDSKFQRCNSLEEISKTKLEDLTEESLSERVNGSSHPVTKKQVTLDDAELGKKSSWDEEVEPARAQTKGPKQERTSPEPVQDSEFHVVTKKQRKKKRRTGCSSRGGSKPEYYSGRDGGSGRLLYQYRRDQGTPQPRRKSASSVPPSDKSDSSDLDSVHSLPVSSSTVRTQVGQNSVSGGSTPQASYADIARTATSPPDGSQVNLYRQEKPAASSFSESCEGTNHPQTLPLPLVSSKKDAQTDTTCDRSPALTSEEYPPLEVKTHDSSLDSSKRSRSAARDNVVAADKVIVNTVPEPVIIVRDSGDGPRSLPTDCTCSKNSESNPSYKRPAVILMNDPTSSGLPEEIQFGFDINYQLLLNDDLQCNDTASAPEQVPTVAQPPPEPVVEDPGCYLAVQDRNLVQYLRTSWEETVEKLRSGKAVYYDGQ